jgi:hypothetical protein
MLKNRKALQHYHSAIANTYRVTAILIPLAFTELSLLLVTPSRSLAFLAKKSSSPPSFGTTRTTLMT